MQEINYSQGRWSNDGVNVPVKLSLYEVTTADRDKGCIPANIGAKRRIGDRTFRLCTTTADLTAGALLSRDVSKTDVAATASLLNAAASVGDTEVTLTSATLLDIFTEATVGHGAGFLRGGYFHVCLGTGLLYTYGIKDNTAMVGDLVTLKLYDPIAVAIPTASTVEIDGNLYHNLVSAATNAEGGCAAVSMVATTAGTDTTVEYFWGQTWGPGSIFVGANIAVGQGVAVDDGTAGRCFPHDAGAEHCVGYCMKIAADNDSALVFIQLDP